MNASLLHKLVFLLLSASCVASPARAITGTWNSNPANGDWNLPSDSTSMGVPNGAADIATFGLSSITSVFRSANTQVDSIVFNAGASAYMISAQPGANLTVSGTGIINDSDVMQTIVAGHEHKRRCQFDSVHWQFRHRKVYQQRK